MIASILGMLMCTLAGLGVTGVILPKGSIARHAPGMVAVGYLLGTGLVALLQFLPPVFGLQFHPWRIFAVLGVITVGCAVASFLRRGSLRSLLKVPVAVEAREWAVFTVLVLVMAMVAWHLMDEAVSRPIFPWDAWSAWSVKAKVWLGLGHYVDFVSFNEWLEAGDPQLYVNEAWRYPEGIALYQLWLTQLNGTWDDRVAVLPWTGMWIAANLAFYHGMRALDASRVFSVGAGLVVLTTPIIAVQIALPGYMDVWLGVCLLSATIWSAVFLRDGCWRSAAIALLVLALAVAIKLEGSLWAAVVLASVGMAKLTDRGRQRVYVALPVLILVWLVSGGFSFEIFGTPIIVTRDLIDLPYIGRVALSVSNPTPALTKAFFVLPNWNLLWYALPFAVIVTLRGLDKTPVRPMFIAFGLFGAGFLVLVFYFTHASMWVQSMTASNRLALQFVLPLSLWLSVGVYQYAYARPDSASA